jgi:glutathione S-transferase
MTETLTIHSFSDQDRSGKLRWTAAELGLAVEEVRVPFGGQRKPPYNQLNPYGHIPAAVFRGEVLVESTAICHLLAEAVASPKLFVAPGEPARRAYLTWLAVFGETLEAPLVACSISRIGLVGPEHFALHERPLRYKLRAAAAQLPAEGYLCGHFTLADVLAGYNLRMAVQCELIARDAVEPYLSRLVARPGAQVARVFDGLDGQR